MFFSQVWPFQLIYWFVNFTLTDKTWYQKYKDLSTFEEPMR